MGDDSRNLWPVELPMCFEVDSMLTKVLVVYSTVLTTLLAAFTFAGSAAARVQHFDEIDAHRINVREPDGTLRMVISNHARLPGVMVRGKEHPPVDRPYAGMLFYNDEGTENGGLTFGGHRNANGEVVDSGVNLSFDRYGASSQFVQLAGKLSAGSQGHCGADLWSRPSLSCATSGSPARACGRQDAFCRRIPARASDRTPPSPSECARGR
jgi:hypothetical protein